MYSYGVVLSEMVTGEKPYAGLNQMQAQILKSALYSVFVW